MIRLYFLYKTMTFLSTLTMILLRTKITSKPSFSYNSNLAILITFTCKAKALISITTLTCKVLTQLCFKA